MVKTEHQKFNDVESLYEFIMRVQAKIAPQIVSQKEAQEGEHRRGVIVIKGTNNWARGFEVQNGLIVPIDNLEDVRTAVVFNNVDTFLHICQELMAGKSSAFARAKARGDLQIIGTHALRDGLIFNRLLGQIGKILNTYGVDFNA